MARTTCGRNRLKYASSGRDPVDRGCRKHGALLAVERPRIVPQAPLDQVEAELREDAGRPHATGELERPRERTATGEHRDEEDEVAGDVPERGALEGVRDDAGKEARLDEDEDRRHEPDRDIHPEQHAHGPGAAQEARVDGAHGGECTAVGHGIRRPAVLDSPRPS